MGKRKLFFLSYAAFVLSIFIYTSCDKLPQNGDLDGMWQVMELEKDGKKIELKDSMLYWSFRINVVQFSSNFRYFSTKHYAHFSKSSSTLSFNDFCTESAYENETDDNEWISFQDSKILNKWCIYPQEDHADSLKVSVTYTIERLTSSSLILYNSSEKITFRKF